MRQWLSRLPVWAWGVGVFAVGLLAYLLLRRRGTAPAVASLPPIGASAGASGGLTAAELLNILGQYQAITANQAQAAAAAAAQAAAPEPAPAPDVYVAPADAEPAPSAVAQTGHAAPSHRFLVVTSAPQADHTRHMTPARSTGTATGAVRSPATSATVMRRPPQTGHGAHQEAVVTHPALVAHRLTDRPVASPADMVTVTVRRPAVRAAARRRPPETRYAAHEEAVVTHHAAVTHHTAYETVHRLSERPAASAGAIRVVRQRRPAPARRPERRRASAPQRRRPAPRAEPRRRYPDRFVGRFGLR